jgi:hypothetical protein
MGVPSTVQNAVRINARMKELVRHGYAYMTSNGVFHPTGKGWGVLMAEAEPPVPMPPPKAKV